MSTFNSDLASGNVAAFNTIIPAGCQDGESNCAGYLGSANQVSPLPVSWNSP